MTMSAVHRSMQPFTGNGDVSIWVKNSRMGRKNPNKQTNYFANISPWRKGVLVILTPRLTDLFSISYLDTGGKELNKWLPFDNLCWVWLYMA